MSLSACFETATTNDCIWIDRIDTADAIVRGSAEYDAVLNEGRAIELLVDPRDILTLKTARQIATHNRTVAENCD